MGFKSLVLVTILVVAAAIAVPRAQALLAGLGQIWALRILGLVYFTPDGNIGANGSTTPVFPNEPMEMRCGGTVVSTTMTNGMGIFDFALGSALPNLKGILTGCSLVVSTPLATCNASLPSIGGLVSALQLVDNTGSGRAITPIGFSTMLICVN